MNRRARHRGFTLLEVLVALAVLAIALSAVIKSAGENAGNAAYLRDRTFAHWVAMNTLAETRLSEDWPGIGLRTGTATQAGRDWSWEMRVTPTPDEGLRRIDIAVRAAGSDPVLSRLTGFVHDPR